MSNYIIHVIRGHVMHTSPLLIKSILKNANSISTLTETNHYFCILLFDPKMPYCSKFDENIYLDLFKQYKTTNYCFVTTFYSFIKFILKLDLKDKLIFHENIPLKQSLILSYILLCLRPKLLKRISLVCWGYNDFAINGKGIKQQLIYRTRRITYSYYKYIILLTSEEEKEFKSLYPLANSLHLPYVSVEKKQLDIKTKKDSTLRIMVSHSGWPHNNHFISFELLSKFKSQNIEIICPLSYGDDNYIRKVIVEGKRIFNNKFTYYQDLIPREQYEEFLKHIDIYISSANCQTGLGNIFLCMQGGAKVFLTGDLLSFFRGKKFIVYDVNTIPRISFESLKKGLTHNEAEYNIDLANKEYNNKEILSRWREIYEY